MILVAMACSETKRPDPGMMPAIDRYDGPMWQTLRAYLVGLHVPPVVWFVSARYGFQPARLPIPDYDDRLTSAPIRIEGNPEGFARAVEAADASLFAGGKLYRDLMRRVAGPSATRATETDGPAIGVHRVQLREFIAKHCR